MAPAHLSPICAVLKCGFLRARSSIWRHQSRHWAGWRHCLRVTKGQSDDQKLHLTLLHSGLGIAWARIALPSLVAVYLCLPFIQWWFLIWLLSLPTVALGLKETAVTGTNGSKPMGRAISWLRAGQQIRKEAACSAQGRVRRHRSKGSTGGQGGDS